MKRAFEFLTENLFYLPTVVLVAIGLRVLVTAVLRMADNGWDGLAYLSLSGVFLLAAAAAGDWVRRMNDEQRVQRALHVQHPEQPWLWRPEWHARRIPVQRPGGVLLFVAFALAWTMMGVAALGSVLSERTSGEGSLPRSTVNEVAVLLVSLLIVVGGVMSVMSVRRALRFWRLERCFLELASLPATLGGLLEGAFWMEPAKWVRDGVQVTVRNVRPERYEPRMPTEMLWEATVTATVRPDNSGAWITFTVPIPSGARPTSFSGSHWNAGRWEVQCGEACIEVPVISAARPS
jgi:hypothetical protein